MYQKSSIYNDLRLKYLLNRIAPFVYILVLCWSLWLLCTILQIIYLPVVINLIYLN